MVSERSADLAKSARLEPKERNRAEITKLDRRSAAAVYNLPGKKLKSKRRFASDVQNQQPLAPSTVSRMPIEFLRTTTLAFVVARPNFE
jgi:hypothetical protein